MAHGKIAQPGAKGEAPGTATAEHVAAAAFEFLAADPIRFGRFLQVTGIPLRSIREAAQEAQFLAGVLDHFGGDEALLLAFAAHVKMEPNEIMRARGILAGHWESDLP